MTIGIKPQQNSQETQRGLYNKKMMEQMIVPRQYKPTNMKINNLMYAEQAELMIKTSQKMGFSEKG